MDQNIVAKVKAFKQERADLMIEAERLTAEAAASSADMPDEAKERLEAIYGRVDEIDAAAKPYQDLLKRDRETILDPEESAGLAAHEGDPWFGFTDAAEFGMAVRAASGPMASVDPRLSKMYAAPTNTLVPSGGDAGEGYLVPPAMRNEIFELVFDGSGMLGMVNVEPTNSNSVELQADETTPWGATGIQAYWRAQAAQMTSSKPSIGNRQTRMHELYAFVNADENLLSDGPRLASRLTKGASEAIRYQAGDAIVNGTGAGQPLGWKNANYGGLVSQAKEGSQAADTVVAGNVAKMYARQLRLSDAVWVCNQDVLPQLFTMTLGDNSIFVPPASGFQNAPGGFLLGRPVVPLEHMETLGDKGDIAIISPSGYHAIGKSGGIQFGRSVHLYFDYGVEAFRWTFRLGGQPFLSAAVSPAKGSTTRGHFVTL
ncbi:MAG TPA: phage major capsid protein, partial [Myxococcota bacterium]